MRNGRNECILRTVDTTTIIADVFNRQIWNHTGHTPFTDCHRAVLNLQD